MTFNPWDYYNKKAKKEGFRARAVYKLEAINQKFRLFGPKVCTVLDLGCAPGSWLQYAQQQLSVKKKCHDLTLIGIDLQQVTMAHASIYTYVQDMTDMVGMEAIMSSHGTKHFDVIMSDAAPNTTGIKDLDAMRSIELIHSSLPVYERWLAPGGKFVIKVFMGEGFDALVKQLKQRYGGASIKVYKPPASRQGSKEVYIVNKGLVKK